MKAPIYNYLITFVVVTISSCASTRLINKKDHLIKKSYTHDTLFLSDYIACYGLRNTFGTEVIPSFPFNKDSLFNHFEISLKRLGLNINVSKINQNKCDSIFHLDWRMKINKINKEKIKTIAQNRNFTIIPFIYFDDYYRRYIYFSSGGVAGGGGYIKKPFLKLIIFILKDKEIIYISNSVHVAKSYHTSSKDNMLSTRKQEHWDNLVELAMRDYIKRMK